MGQSRLMHAYEQEFEAVQRRDGADPPHLRGHPRTGRATSTSATRSSPSGPSASVPIVNENDTVSFDEIRFGDNDIISAHLANMLDADLLVILTDTDGVYDSEPAGAPRRADPAHRGEGDRRRPRRRGGQGIRVLLGRHGVEDPRRRHRHAQRRGRGDRARATGWTSAGSSPGRRSARGSCPRRAG